MVQAGINAASKTGDSIINFAQTGVNTASNIGDGFIKFADAVKSAPSNLGNAMFNAPAEFWRGLKSTAVFADKLADDTLEALKWTPAVAKCLVGAGLVNAGVLNKEESSK